MLKLAALSGVDVRVLISERPDNPLTYFAAYAFLDSLLEAGVEVYRYEGASCTARPSWWTTSARRQAP